MLIDAYIFCWNEEKLLPFTLDYYSEFCDSITLLDNFSTDSSLEIAKKYSKVKVVTWGMEGVYDDRVLTLAKNRSYKDHGRGEDWAIVADCDEYLYHPDVREKLKEYMLAGVTLPLTQGFEMISNEFPKLGTPLLEQIKTGVPFAGMSKSLVFDPRINLVYNSGSHQSSVDPNFGVIMIEEDGGRSFPPPVSSYKPVMSERAEFKVLHYKDLSPEYKMERLEVLAPRLSQWCLENEQTSHWLQTDDQVLDYFDRTLKLAEEVI